MAFFQIGALLFLAFFEKVLTLFSVNACIWPELLIRRHFLAERRGLQIIRNYFPNLGVVYPLLR